MSTAESEERRPALVSADAGEQAWADTVRFQRWATPDHADFYALAAAVVPTLYVLEDLANVLRQQVSRYAEGRRLYDDTREIDPAVRLADAAERLTSLRDALATAHEQANGFWSAISHIGVEVTT